MFCHARLEPSSLPSYATYNCITSYVLRRRVRRVYVVDYILRARPHVRSSQKSGNTALPGVSCLFSFALLRHEVAHDAHHDPSLVRSVDVVLRERARVLAATRSYVVVDAHKSHGGTPWKKDAPLRAAPGAPSGAPCRPPAPTTGCNSKLSRHRRSERKSRARLWESAQPRAPRTGASTARATPKLRATWRGARARARFSSARALDRRRGPPRRCRAAPTSRRRSSRGAPRRLPGTRGSAATAPTSCAA